jgi:hypothetical protein
MYGPLRDPSAFQTPSGPSGFFMTFVERLSGRLVAMVQSARDLHH